jgi:hypothetical protein
MNFSEDKTEKVDDIELCEKKIEARTKESVVVKIAQHFLIASSLTECRILTQIHNHEFVFHHGLQTPLYILFDSFLI